MFVNYSPARYGKDYYYPMWADIIGWMILLSSFIWIPIMAIWMVFTHGKGSLIQVGISHSLSGKYSCTHCEYDHI